MSANPDRHAKNGRRRVVVLAVLTVTAVVGVLAWIWLRPSPDSDNKLRPDRVLSIAGANMVPTLRPDDRIGVTTGVQAVKQGDIVVLRQRGGAQQTVQRIIAGPGETFEAHDGKVYINGKALEEPYLAPGMATRPYEPVTIPPDSYWVMGDNRANSRDSQAYGPIGRHTIEGVVTSIVSPASRVRSFV